MDGQSALSTCGEVGVSFDHYPLRIGSVFILLLASALGSLLPIFLSRATRFPVPKLLFFLSKYVGSGVIIATAWMHLLSPAVESLHNECLASRLGDYDWAFFIGLMTVMVMFLVELVASKLERESHEIENDKSTVRSNSGHDISVGETHESSVIPGVGNHLSHAAAHVDGDSAADFAGQITSILILEFGVVFHSVFIGLALSTSNNFIVLLIVLIIHQLFEGLGLGSRLAATQWGPQRRWVPWILACVFGLATPIGIAAGLATKYVQADTQILLNGIFDSISAGILMYTGLVELLAHEFMFNEEMRNASLGRQLFAYACVVSGVVVMAVLAKWA